MVERGFLVEKKDGRVPRRGIVQEVSGSRRRSSLC